MDSIDLIRTEAVSPAKLLENLKAGKKTDAKTEQFAKDFESIFIGKLMEEMKNSIGDWGLEKDAASDQIQGIFWMHLAQDVANNGGMGMWKDIYKFFSEAQNTNSSAEMLDKKI